MLKFARVSLHAGDRALWLNPDHVVEVQSADEGCFVTMSTRRDDGRPVIHHVAEPVEEVVARLAGGAAPEKG